jgi:hypothetical protein
VVGIATRGVTLISPAPYSAISGNPIAAIVTSRPRRVPGRAWGPSPETAPGRAARSGGSIPTMALAPVM